jgi:hypothetical protein
MELLTNFGSTNLTAIGPLTPNVNNAIPFSVVDTDGNWHELNTPFGSNSFAAIFNFSLLRRDWEPEFYSRIQTYTLSNIRYWIGLFSGSPVLSATPALHLAAFRFDTSAGDTSWQFCTGNGASTACSDTGITVSPFTTYSLGVICSNADCKGYVNGVLAATRATNLPGLTSTMGYNFAVTTVVGPISTLRFGRLAILHK